MNENIIVAITKLNEIVTDIDKDDTCFLDIKDTVEEVIALLKSHQPHLLTVEEINALPEGSVCWEEFRDEDGVINNDLTPAMKWGLLSLVNGEADVTCLNAYGTQGYSSGQARSRWWSAKPTDEQRKAVAWE